MKEDILLLLLSFMVSGYHQHSQFTQLYTFRLSYYKQYKIMIYFLVMVIIMDSRQQYYPRLTLRQLFSS